MLTCGRVLASGLPSNANSRLANGDQDLLPAVEARQDAAILLDQADRLDQHEGLAGFSAEQGVVFIGRAQEKTSLSRTEKRWLSCG